MLGHGVVQRAFVFRAAADSAMGSGPWHTSAGRPAVPDCAGRSGRTVRRGHRAAIVRQPQDRHPVASTLLRTALGWTLGDCSRTRTQTGLRQR